MSHFNVLVIGDNHYHQMEPFMENNMDDCPKEFLEFLDQQERVRIGYETDEVEKDGKKVPAKEAFSSMDEYAEEYFGLTKDPETGKYGYWENPNAKWDWYSVGGRWVGYFKVKDNVKITDDMLGDTGLATKRPDPKERRVDTCLKGEVDWEAMHRNPKEFEEYKRQFLVLTKQIEPMEGDEIFSLYKPKYFIDRYGTPERYAECMTSFSTFAVVKDGEWFEEGEMGWFGSSDETHEEAVDWELNFYKRFIEPLPDDTRLTLIDCHI